MDMFPATRAMSDGSLVRVFAVVAVDNGLHDNRLQPGPQGLDGQRCESARLEAPGGSTSVRGRM